MFFINNVLWWVLRLKLFTKVFVVIGEMGLVDSCWKDRFLTYMIGDFFKLGFLENTDFSGNFLMNIY